MAGDEEQVVISEDQLKRFTEKLTDWGQDLPEDEQRVLRLLLSRVRAAAQSQEEVQAFSHSMPSNFSVAMEDALKPAMEEVNTNPVSYPDTIPISGGPTY